MKILHLFFLIVGLLCFAEIANAQIKPAQSQYLKEKGFLVNPSFEQGYKKWTIGGTCTKSLVADVPYLNRTLKLTCVNQTFSVKQETSEQTDFAGQQGVFNLQIKTSTDGVRITHLAGGSRSGELIVQAKSTYQRVVNIPYVVNGTSNGVEIYSDVNVTGDIYIDDVSFGLAPDGFVATDYDDVPVGTVLSYGSTTPPAGYLLADGACYLKTQYAELFDVIGTSGGECTISTTNDGFNVPNLQNMFLRGLPSSGRSVFDFQADADQRITGNVSTGTANNVHGMFQASSGAFNGLSNCTNGGAGNLAGSSCKTANFDSAAVVNTASESRPDNRAVVYIIKAVGRANLTTVTQKSLSPMKAGFITWSAFDAEIDGHLKANGACVLKTAYPDYTNNMQQSGFPFGECTISTSNDGVLLPDLISGNRYVRAAGGSISLGQQQDDATAVNGLTIPDHRHNLLGNTSGGSHVNLNHPSANAISGQTSGTGIGYINASLAGSGSFFVENTSLSLSGDTETRPITMALIPYVRMIDADKIIGVFEQIKSDELISGRFYRNGNQGGFSDNGIIIFNDVDTGTATNNIASFNFSTGEFTSPKDACYKMEVGAILLTPDQNTRVYIRLQINTASKAYSSDHNGTSTLNTLLNLSTGKVCMNEGDVARIRIDTGTVNTKTVAGGADSTWWSINEMADTQAIVKNLNDNATHRLGDCKFSILDADDFNKIHSGSWVRLEGQSIAGSEIANRFGITSLPDAVSNGAFFRQQGGNSAAMRTFQNDQFQGHWHTLTGWTRNNQIGDYNIVEGRNTGVARRTSLDGFAENARTDNVNGSPRTGNETRPKNIALNFYCLVNE